MERMGRVDGNEKCPLNLFILCKYIDKVFDGTGGTRWTGGTGWTGWTEYQKGPLIFFILRYIKNYTHIYINIYLKNVLTNFLWILNFGQVGGPDAKIQKYPLGWVFLKSY